MTWPECDNPNKIFETIKKNNLDQNLVNIYKENMGHANYNVQIFIYPILITPRKFMKEKWGDIKIISKNGIFIIISKKQTIQEEFGETKNLIYKATNRSCFNRYLKLI